MKIIVYVESLFTNLRELLKTLTHYKLDIFMPDHVNKTCNIILTLVSTTKFKLVYEKMVTYTVVCFRSLGCIAKKYGKIYVGL